MTSFILDGTTLPFPKVDLVPLGSAPANKYSVASDWNTVCQASVDMQTFLRGNFLLFMNGDPSTRAGLVLSNGAPVVTANKGSLALDITTPAVYQNQDGAGTWLPIGGGGGGMAIGSPVTGGTVGSLLFVGASTFLQQDNANFFVDNTLKRIGIGNAAPGTTLDLASSTTTAGLALRAGSTTGLSVAGTGRFRFNEGTNKMQVSLNGAAYVDLDTSAPFTLDIGDGIGSSTVGALLFVGAGNVLQQDPTKLFWDDTNNRFTVGAGGITKVGFEHEFSKDAALAVVASAYGTGLNAEFMAFRGRGTGAATTAVLSGDVLGAFSYAGATTPTAIKSGAFTRALATENWSGTANGTKLETYTIPNTTAVAVVRTTVDQDGVFYVEGAGLISKASSSAAGFFNTAMFTAGGASTSFAQADRELRIQQGANAAGQRYQYLTFNGRWSGNIDAPTLTQGLFDRVSGIEFDAAADSLGPNPNASINFFVHTGAKGTGAETVVTPTRAMTITYTARVGVGTTNPSQPFDVETIIGNTNAKFGSSLPVYIVSAQPNVGMNAYFNSGWKFGKGSSGSRGGTMAFDTTTGELAWGISSNTGAADAALTMVTRMTLSAAGALTVPGIAATNSLILTTGNGLISNGQLQVTRDHATDGQVFVYGSNAGNTQPSAIGFLNQVASFRSYVGYFPSLYAFTHLRLLNGWFAQANDDIAFGNTTENAFRFGMTTNAAFLAQANGSAAALSAANTGRLRYTTTGQKFQVSVNTGAYVDLLTAAYFSVERLSVDGAADPNITTTFVSGTGTDLTLANGTIDGYIKNFVVTGGSGTITPANLADGNTLTYAAGPANVSFIWDATGATWHVYGNPYNMVTT